METITVKVVNQGNQPLPQYATKRSSGMDIRADIPEPIVLAPGQRSLIPSGIHMQLPEGYECQLRPRSGLMLKHGVSCHFGTIDEDYLGDVGIILINFSDTAYKVEPGERVGQLVFTKYAHVNWDPALFLDETERGEGGFGHSGKQ